MKTVFDTRQCAHVWAQQTQQAGRNAGNSVSFEGETLFSYSTAIAKLYRTARDEQFVLATSRTFSITTSSKHMPAMLRAVSHLPVIQVPFVTDTFGHGGMAGNCASLEDMHARNLEHFKDLYAQRIAYLKRCRDLNRPAAESLAQVIFTVNRYCRLFSLQLQQFSWEADGAAIDAYRDALAAKRDTPAYRAAQARKAAAKAAREAKALDELRARWAQDAAEWLKGNRTHLPHAYPETLLRVMHAADEVQTSRGARFPVPHAKLAFRVVARCKERGEAWHRNGHAVHLGHFQIDSISPEGDVKAGCHFVRWPAIEHAARELGLI